MHFGGAQGVLLRGKDAEHSANVPRETNVLKLIS